MKPKFTLSNTSWGQSPGQLLGTEEEEPSKKTGEKKKKNWMKTTQKYQDSAEADSTHEPFHLSGVKDGTFHW